MLGSVGSVRGAWPTELEEEFDVIRAAGADDDEDDFDDDDLDDDDLDDEDEDDDEYDDDLDDDLIDLDDEYDDTDEEENRPQHPGRYDD